MVEIAKKEKKQDPACCYQMLTMVNLAGSCFFGFLEVLRHVKARPTLTIVTHKLTANRDHVTILSGFNMP